MRKAAPRCGFGDHAKTPPRSGCRSIFRRNRHRCVAVRAVHDAERAHLLITEDTDGEERNATLTFGELYAAGQRCAAELGGAECLRADAWR